MSERRKANADGAVYFLTLTVLDGVDAFIRDALALATRERVRGTRERVLSMRAHPTWMIAIQRAAP